FVSNVSHELRTPLAMIRLYAETLAEGRVAPARRQHYVETIVSESERLSRLVDNVLAFGRAERGEATAAHVRLDVGALAAGVAERYRPVLDRAGAALSITVAPDLPPVSADADALAEALVNLLDNAARYGGGTPVGLSVRADGRRVVVEVADEGLGLLPADRERVFEPFVRVQAPSSDGLAHTAKGTGLGLALVRRIAEAHGGTVSAHGRRGGGALFRLTLPAAP
ncbi:MAG TPA: HAMP domain-containing sensor histidine kinase, partial [Rubricoccaceae bacterium]